MPAVLTFVLFQPCTWTFAVIKSYSVLSIYALAEQTSECLHGSGSVCSAAEITVTSPVPAHRELRLWGAGRKVIREPPEQTAARLSAFPTWPCGGKGVPEEVKFAWSSNVGA